MALDSIPLIRSWLYVPGSSVRMLERVFDAGADAAVLDLEDSVPLAEKPAARALVVNALDSRSIGEGSRTLAFVRINAVSTDGWAEDVRAVVRPGLGGLRIAKVESPEEVTELDERIGRAEREASLPLGSLPIVCGIESASAALAAAAIAAASPRVMALAFGAADFMADVGGTESPERNETLWARSRLVAISRAAGLRPPIDAVHTALDDEEGLRRSTVAGRDLGFFGRSAIHPRQVPTINEIYTPAPAAVERASRIVMRADEAAAQRRGALRLEDGSFVDAAVVRHARGILALSREIDSTPRTGRDDD